MDLLILRLIHIVAGAFWVGAVFTTVLFLTPAAVALGPQAGPFQLQLIREQRLPAAVLVSAATTVLSGIALLWVTSNGLDGELLFAESRLGYTVGGVIAILTFAIGSLYVYPRTVRVGRIMGAAKAEGRGPTPEELAQLVALRGDLGRSGWVVVTGVGLAVAAMATARYWGVIL